MNTSRPIVVWGFARDYALQREGRAIDSYAFIHAGYVKAFTALGFPTMWLDDLPTSPPIPQDAIILCMNSRAAHLPKRPDLFYVGHNLEFQHVQGIPENRRMGIQYWFSDCPGVEQGAWWVKWDKVSRQLFMPWAADLLPSEIGDTVCDPVDSSVVNWVGSVWSDKSGGVEMGNVAEMDELRRALAKHGLELNVRRPLDCDHARLIRESRIAPAMQGAWQVNKGYLPCRAFKNASFGQMVITNNPLVEKLFDGFTCYSPAIVGMIEQAMAREENFRWRTTFQAMRIVRERHCYTHRVAAMMKVVDSLA